MKKTIKFTAAVAMIGLLAFTSAGCGGGDKKHWGGYRLTKKLRQPKTL